MILSVTFRKHEALIFSFRLLNELRILSTKDFDKLVDVFFDSCGPEQRWRLQEKLPHLLFRDFFRDLPAELLDKVLRYLDGPNLLNCLKVSKTWNERLTENENLWRVNSNDFIFL